MKKIILLAMSLFSVVSLSFAQTVDHSLEFVDKDGNIIADGSVITRSEVEDSYFSGAQIGSGLFAKNTTGGVVNFGFVTTIVSMPSGSFSHCFPGNCKNTPAPVSNSVDERKVGTLGTSLKADESASLMSEWIIDEGKYGKTTVTYQFKIYEVDASTFEFKYKADGPKVTVVYDYKDPAGIEGVTVNEVATPQQLFDFSGRKVTSPIDGKIYIGNNKKYIYHK